MGFGDGGCLLGRTSLKTDALFSLQHAAFSGPSQFHFDICRHLRLSPLHDGIITSRKQPRSGSDIKRNGSAIASRTSQHFS
jgi:hypothetical protein